jgi:hypothetical protein
VRFNVFTLGGDCGGSTVTAGVIVDNGRGRNRVGEGDRFAEPFRGGGRSPPSSVASLCLPRIPRSPSPAGITDSSRPDATFTGSPAPALLYVGLGETALGALWLGFEFAICSKCERREDTGF